MAKFDERREADLAAIRSAIANGNLDEARRLLRAVSLNFRTTSKFSREVGQLYFDLGFPAMAGRYWYLIEPKSAEMITACAAFEHSLGDNPFKLMEQLAWAPEASPEEKARLTELGRAARDFRQEFQYPQESPSRLKDRVALVGCAIVAFAVLFIFGMGLTFIATWFE
jgi:hypothetical protein